MDLTLKQVSEIKNKNMTNKAIKRRAMIEKTKVASITQPPKVEEFDMERLCKEIDKSFQKLSSEKEKEYSNKLQNLAKEQLNNVDSFYKDLNSYIESQRENLLNALVKTSISQLVINDEVINIDLLDHPETKAVVGSLKRFKKALMVGPAGTGKSTLAYKIAEKLNLPFFKYGCSRDSSVHDFIGYKQPKSEEYLNTAFLQCYEKGGVFLIDEYDAASSDMSIFFNGIADNTPFISIPHRDSNPTAKKHKDFYIIFSGNTWGSGGIEYSGRDFQDKALLDRFRICKHYIGYHTLLEKSLCGNDKNYKFILDLRKNLEEIGSYLSTRNIEDISKILTDETSYKHIVNILTRDLSELDKKQLMKKI